MYWLVINITLVKTVVTKVCLQSLGHLLLVELADRADSALEGNSHTISILGAHEVMSHLLCNRQLASFFRRFVS